MEGKREMVSERKRKKPVGVEKKSRRDESRAIESLRPFYSSHNIGSPRHGVAPPLRRRGCEARGYHQGEDEHRGAHGCCAEREREARIRNR